MTIEDRLVAIETKISFQEDNIQELNNVAYRQQKKIEQLEAICNYLINQIRDLSESASEGAERHEKPPHY